MLRATRKHTVHVDRECLLQTTHTQSVHASHGHVCTMYTTYSPVMHKVCECAMSNVRERFILNLCVYATRNVHERCIRRLCVRATSNVRVRFIP
jgi:hypothetical protein